MYDILPHVLQLGPLYMVAVAASFVLIRSGPSFMGRWNERLRDLSKAKAGDWARLREEIERRDEQMAAQDARHAAEIERVDGRCARIEERERDCQSQLTEALHRIGELEGYNMGRGTAKQEAQMIVSAERQIDAAERKTPKKPGLRRDKR